MNEVDYIKEKILIANSLNEQINLCKLIINQNLDNFPYLQLPIISNKPNLLSWFDKAKEEGHFKPKTDCSRHCKNI